MHLGTYFVLLLASTDTSIYMISYVIVCMCLQIHWFSIFNSFMMVIFLVGLVSMILMRTLRKDYARYSKEEDIDEMVLPLTIYGSYCLLCIKLRHGLTLTQTFQNSFVMYLVIFCMSIYCETWKCSLYMNKSI